jgi:hypothetical protein
MPTAALLQSLPWVVFMNIFASVGGFLPRLARGGVWNKFRVCVSFFPRSRSWDDFEFVNCFAVYFARPVALVRSASEPSFRALRMRGLPP